MRQEFRSQLSQVSRTLVAMAEAVRVAMNVATEGLLKSDAARCQRVVHGDDEIDALYRILEDSVVDLLARQAPVASDLRLLVTSLHIAVDVERMGDLAERVARTALLRHPACAVPDPLISVFTEMGEVSDQMAGKIASALSTLDAVAAAELQHDDDRMDALYRRLFAVVLGPDWHDGVEAGIDTALLGRYYERYGDHAVNAGERLVFLVTGESLQAGS
jgi:phosphate transport system protein